MPLKIFDLQIDDWNEAEAARHGVTAREMRQVLDYGEPIFRRNKRPHAAPVLMIGPTLAGRFLTIPITQTEVEGTWRPATAFDSVDPEVAAYRAQRGTGHVR